MSSDFDSEFSKRAPDELPPVDPPSAKFIMQLFVVPFLVVVVLVCVLLLVYGLFGKVASSPRDALDYVQTIRAGNENRRWRAAYELASLIHNEPQLRRDAKLQSDLSELLQDELRKPIDARNAETLQYLALALGAFDRLDLGAVDALVAALSEKVEPRVRAAAAQSVARQAAKPDNGIDAARVVPALVSAARDNESETRQHAAYALGYFDSAEARNALAELVGDDNRLVRYNAAAALARLDDPAALNVLREMLSTRDLELAFAAELKDRTGPTQNMIDAVQLEALAALSDASASGKTQVSSTLRADLEMLAESGPRNIQLEARGLLKNLQSSVK